MEKHRSVLAALFLALGVFGFVGLLVVTVIFGGGASVVALVAAHEQDVPPFVPLLPLIFGAFLALVILVATIPNFIAAYALFTERPWAPMAALLVGILNLLNFPLGTGVGIYAIWYYLTLPVSRTGTPPSNPSAA
ncbi:MAG: hypothetical protein Kow00109_01790 [Acidobacteriota bacterium]